MTDNQSDGFTDVYFNRIKRIENFVAEKNITRYELSESSGISEDILSLIFSGRLHFEEKYYHKICKALKRTFDAD